MAPRIITRPEAKAKGRTFYFTGKPCPRGHVAPRYVCAYTCRDCVKNRVLTPAQMRRMLNTKKRWARRNKERMAIYWRQYRLLHRAHKRRYLKRWYRANRERVAAYRRTPKMLASARIRKNLWYRMNRARVLAKLRTPKMRAIAAARARLWNRAHPAAKRAYRSARRTTRGSHTPQQS